MVFFGKQPRNGDKFLQVISNEGLLAGKTRILVTHGLQFLPMVDFIVVIQDGRVSESGTYGDLSSREDSSFAQWLNEEIKIEEEKEKKRSREDSETTPLGVVSTSFDSDNSKLASQAKCSKPGVIKPNDEALTVVYSYSTANPQTRIELILCYLPL